MHCIIHKVTVQELFCLSRHTTTHVILALSNDIRNYNITLASLTSSDNKEHCRVQVLINILRPCHIGKHCFNMHAGKEGLLNITITTYKTLELNIFDIQFVVWCLLLYCCAVRKADDRWPIIKKFFVYFLFRTTFTAELSDLFIALESQFRENFHWNFNNFVVLNSVVAPK